MAKINLGRALTARIATRFIRLATLVVLGVFGLLFIVCALLVYFFSAWWWLITIPLSILLIIFLLLRGIVLFIVRRIHSERLSDQQAQALDDFVGKIESLLEARATPPWVFAMISIKDLLLYRDVKTIKSIISDTAGLKREYQALEKLF